MLPNCISFTSYLNTCGSSLNNGLQLFIFSASVTVKKPVPLKKKGSEEQAMPPGKVDGSEWGCVA